jgi:hypothetical protein
MKTSLKVLLGATSMSLILTGSLQAENQRDSGKLQISTIQPAIERSANIASESKKIGGRHDGKAVYIVRMKQPSLAKYEGGISGFTATSPKSLGEEGLNVSSKASKDYRQFLQANQQAFVHSCEQTFGHQLNVKHNYQHVINGVAVELTREEASVLAAMPEVVSIQRERIEMPLTDVGPKWIGKRARYHFL